LFQVNCQFFCKKYLALKMGLKLLGARSSAVEQWTHNPLVQGSNPCGPIFIEDIQLRYYLR
jgi:hypothetical protein